MKVQRHKSFELESKTQEKCSFAHSCSYIAFADLLEREMALSSFNELSRRNTYMNQRSLNSFKRTFHLHNDQKFSSYLAENT